ncbi:tRNA (adenosine(37)-N6)-threonylcarbamoyltransferase complex transferase subunit TsaD [bacterium]|nr:tRNA (adenosine(37)-N6)-threonylcarbamoyltransferase complex transferase subunit TsaD [bacterium]
MKVLGIETSCDETGVALVIDGAVVEQRVATQVEHAEWGGVVPEIASRLHQRALAKMTQDVMQAAGLGHSDLDGIAATHGPGLIGALLVGVSFAKGLAVAHRIPFIGVNHLEAHIFSPHAAGEVLPMPALALLVSGGHTELFRVNGFGRYQLLGATLDDAVGEAFDKVGGLLEIEYPAGAALSRLAASGDPQRFTLPVPRTEQPFQFSFSGLKTAALRLVQSLEGKPPQTWRADLAASFQEAAVTQLIVRLDRALENEWYRSVVLAGGVAANQLLRKRAEQIAARHDIPLFRPPLQLCTDNAEMIAWVGWKRLTDGCTDPLDLEADPNLSLAWDDLSGTDHSRGGIEIDIHSRAVKKKRGATS